VPDGTIVELQPIGEGRYRASSSDAPELLWMAGERYRITFELDDPELAGDFAGEEFIAVVDAPADEISFNLERAPAFVGDTAELRWSPSSLDAMIEVYGPDGELIFTTFDTSEPSFDGSKWGSLARYGQHTLPVDVLDRAGSYTISACVIASQEGFDAELSAALGSARGFWPASALSRSSSKWQNDRRCDRPRSREPGAGSSSSRFRCVWRSACSGCSRRSST
jgi:predicted dehydrogenase